MQISYMGEGPYPTLSTVSTILRIKVGDAFFDVDCLERQEYSPIHVDVVLTAGGLLSDDITQGYMYVANVDIPGATIEYDEQTGEEHIVPFKPSDFEKVRVNLWTVTVAADGE